MPQFRDLRTTDWLDVSLQTLPYFSAWGRPYLHLTYVRAHRFGVTLHFARKGPTNAYEVNHRRVPWSLNFTKSIYETNLV
nr:MAG TPA: VWA / Hh protein [Caudoviricetes sp.]